MHGYGTQSRLSQRVHVSIVGLAELRGRGKIRGVSNWVKNGYVLNLFAIREVFGIDLLFHRPIRRVKIKISSKSVGPVVLISSSMGESNGSKLKSEDYVFLDTLPYEGYRKKWNDPSWPLPSLSRICFVDMLCSSGRNIVIVCADHKMLI